MKDLWGWQGQGHSRGSGWGREDGAAGSAYGPAPWPPAPPWSTSASPPNPTLGPVPFHQATKGPSQQSLQPLKTNPHLGQPRQCLPGGETEAIWHLGSQEHISQRTISRLPERL